ncbi:MAG: ribosome biogenesis GTP-binding protein YihA/YsxC [Bacteroidota bacterium]
MQIKKADFVKSSSKLKDCPPPDRNEYAFVGRSNVGKSTLINMLLRRKRLAKTSSTPGKTQLINHFLINDEWFMVDLPGYGYAKASKRDRLIWQRFIKNYLLKRENLLYLFLLIDSRHKPMAIDFEFINWLGINTIPFVLVFTKSDKLNKVQLEENINKFKLKMYETWDELPETFITSSVNDAGRLDILNFIDKTNFTVKN